MIYLVNFQKYFTLKVNHPTKLWMFWNLKVRLNYFAEEWNHCDFCGVQTPVTDHMMEQATGFVFHIPTAEGAETLRREEEALASARSAWLPFELSSDWNSGTLFPLWSTGSYWNLVPRRGQHFSLYLNKQWFLPTTSMRWKGGKK